MPCQAEEEVHQLSYVQKHLPSLLALLAESTEDGEDSTKVLLLQSVKVVPPGNLIFMTLLEPIVFGICVAVLFNLV